MLWIYPSLFICQLMDHLGCFQILVVTNNDALTIHIHVFVKTYAFLSLG